MTHPSLAELEAGLEQVRRSPADVGVLELIVRRPGVDAREALAWGELDEAAGLLGDRWGGDEGDEGDWQVTLMNARAAALVAQTPDRWALAGDQLYIDFDLSEDNAPPGTRLAIGAAVVEITPAPHTGCKKFATRFGADAATFVNSPIGKHLHLRG